MCARACTVPGDVLPTAAMTTSSPDELPPPPPPSYVDVATVDVEDVQRQWAVGDETGAGRGWHRDLVVDYHAAGRS